MIMRYRKKPVVIEAVRLTEDNLMDVWRWVSIGVHGDIAKRQIVIHTLEGDITAQLGDYVIKGIKGEFYPCKADIFEASYEVVE
jgi:hypothetical protein